MAIAILQRINPLKSHTSIRFQECSIFSGSGVLGCIIKVTLVFYVFYKCLRLPERQDSSSALIVNLYPFLICEKFNSTLASAVAFWASSKAAVYAGSYIG